MMFFCENDSKLKLVDHPAITYKSVNLIKFSFQSSLKNSSLISKFQELKIEVFLIINLRIL